MAPSVVRQEEAPRSRGRRREENQVTPRLASARVLSFAPVAPSTRAPTDQGGQPCPPTPGQWPRSGRGKTRAGRQRRSHQRRARPSHPLPRVPPPDARERPHARANPMAGDRVSLEYLKADLYRRAEALKDLPDAPLFFGRLDYSELARTDEDFAGADFHIGRRHVHDQDGTPVVHRLAGARLAAVLPGQPVRPDGPHAAAAVRLLRGSAHRLRRRAVRAAAVKHARPFRRITAADPASC